MYRVCESSASWTILVTDEVFMLQVFISSTFLDMHAERNILTTIVFPQANARAREFGFILVPMDLRW